MKFLEHFDKEAMESMINTFAKNRKTTPEKVIEDLSQLDGRTLNMILLYYEMGFIQGKNKKDHSPSRLGL